MVSYFINPETNQIIQLDTNYFYKEGPNVYRILYNTFTKKEEWMLYINIQLEYIKILENQLNTPWNDGQFSGLARLERIVVGPEKFYLGDIAINSIKTQIIYSYIGDYIVDGKKEPMNEVLMNSYEWFGYKVGIVKELWQNDEFEKILIDYYIPD